MRPFYKPPNRLEIKMTDGEEEIRINYPDIKNKKFGPNQICEIFDPTTNIVWGYVAVDRLIRGDTSIGGIRFRQDLTLEEVVNLASDMTYKNSGAKLGVAGGKSGMRINPDYFKIWEGETDESPSFIKRKEEKKELMEMIAGAIAHMNSYTIAPDMGTDGRDMLNIYMFYEKMFGKNHGRGGLGREGALDIDGWGCTAQGLLQVAKSVENHFNWFHIENAKVSINGFGNVGGYTAKLLSEEGAKIIAVNDYNGVICDEKGLNVDELLSLRKDKDGIMGYQGEAIRYDARKFDGKKKRKVLEELFKIPCDMLIPAAVRDVIHSDNYKNIDTKIIIPGANGPVPENIEKKIYFEKRIITMTDWIVNAGGVMATYFELEMDRNPQYAEIVKRSDGVGKEYVNKRIGETISENVIQIFEMMEIAKKVGKELLFRDASVELAEEYLTSSEKINDVRL